MDTTTVMAGARRIEVRPGRRSPHLVGYGVPQPGMDDAEHLVAVARGGGPEAVEDAYRQAWEALERTLSFNEALDREGPKGWL